MGEIADMMLDGTLCSCCGVFLGADSGAPGLCASCRKDDAMLNLAQPPKLAMPPVVCPTCGKKVKMTGIADHWRALHR